MASDEDTQMRNGREARKEGGGMKDLEGCGTKDGAQGNQAVNYDTSAANLFSSLGLGVE